MQNDDCYGINRWGGGYFKVNQQGNISVKPGHNGGEGDMFELMQSLVAKGIEAPILIRFNGIIRDRIQIISDAFARAIKECNYRNLHRLVYPIKVNPQCHLVEAVRQAGHQYQMGIEVGSKPELMAVLCLEDSTNGPLLCNGYKDAEYITLALMASKLGRTAHIIIEQPYELNLVLEVAQKLDVQACIGLRMKLSSTGAGRWKTSGGEHSKFGLFAHDIITCVETLEKANKKHWLKLLHFHLGSQVTSIEAFKKALREAARMYTELALMAPSLHIFDVGGGLAIDYDGSNSPTNSSMNYTIDEYARDVVDIIGQACLSCGLADPIIVTESGRAIVSHQSVLITEVIDVSTKTGNQDESCEAYKHEIIDTLNDFKQELTCENCRETFHDVIELKSRIYNEFIYGKLSLKQRAYAEKLSRQLLLRIRSLFQKNYRDFSECIELEKMLLETYFCNFSVFQSMPDSWAIGQLFPVIPIQKLNIQATHQAVLADLTCDSDGKIDNFIGETYFLNLHEYKEEPYYVGIFLVGAYQEILGGLHNLFGDTNVVHAELSDNGSWELSGLVEGDTIKEVLEYVQYRPETLLTRLHTMIETSLKEGRISMAESAKMKKHYKQALQSYTYLVV